MFCILLGGGGVFNRYEVIYMYVLYIVGGVYSVRGDIYVCFVYSWRV